MASAKRGMSTLRTAALSLRGCYISNPYQSYMHTPLLIWQNTQEHHAPRSLHLVQLSLLDQAHIKVDMWPLLLIA